MFWRILWRLLYASRGRLALAVLAVASGAAVCAALLNLDLDATDKLTREFRVLGANIVVSEAQTVAPVLTMDAKAINEMERLQLPEVVGFAPYLYLSADAQAGGNSTGVIVAGTWFDEAARMNSWWKVDGSWVHDRDDRSDCMIGEQAAARLGLIPGQSVKINYPGREATLRVAGIVTAGSSEAVSYTHLTLPTICSV